VLADARYRICSGLLPVWLGEKEGVDLWMDVMVSNALGQRAVKQ